MAADGQGSHTSVHAVFPVHYSTPNPLLRLVPAPDTHWKLFGAGTLVFKRYSIVLRGYTRRPFGLAMQHSPEIPLSEVLNATCEGRVVRFQVRIPLCSEKALQLWAEDEVAARRIIVLLSETRARPALWNL